MSIRIFDHGRAFRTDIIDLAVSTHPAGATVSFIDGQGRKATFGNKTPLTSQLTVFGDLPPQIWTFKLEGFEEESFTFDTRYIGRAVELIIDFEPIQSIPSPTPKPSPLPDNTERVNCNDLRAIGNLPDGTCFANLITPEPSPKPDPAPPQFELYEIDIIAPINPHLPNWLVERLRAVMFAGGWELSNISRTNEGYKMQVAKRGSVSGVVIITMISVVLALLLIKIISVAITRLSDNKRDMVVSENIKNSINTVIDYCNKNGLSQEECNELLAHVKEVYEAVVPPPPDDNGGLFGGIFDNIELVVGAILIISLIGAVRR